MTHKHKEGGCCGDHNKNSKGEQEKSEKKNTDCCHDKEKDKKPEKNMSDSSGGCCGGH